jgi:hypothetical protein
MDRKKNVLKNYVLTQVLCFLTFGVVFFAATAWSQEDTADVNQIRIKATTCKQLMGGNDLEREVGIAFYHGYLAGKNDSQSIDLPTTAAWTDRVREYCLMNPTSSVMEAFITTK